MSSQSLQGQVRRRRVFYIPGYDPMHARRYRELYRKEGAEQARISGYDIVLRPKSGGGRYGWNVTSTQDGGQVDTEFDVLVWSDIVRDSMSGTIARTCVQTLGMAWIYVSTGTLRRMMRLRKGPVIAALYPVGMLVLQLMLALMLGLAVALASLPYLGWIGLVGALVVAIGVLRWFRKLDNRLLVYYLLHNYIYSSRLRGRVPPELKARIAEFTALIGDAMRSEVEEVLVVGHSSGAHIGVSVLADLIRSGTVSGDGPALSFLTLGQVMPMVSFLPEAQSLRADLHLLGTCDIITWVDVTAPGDGCAFALCDPVSVSGVAADDKRWPLVLSAAFTQTLSPERWKVLRRRFFRVHFQYLCAFDRPRDYDYFRITAGPKTLAERFAGRKPSKSRIDKPVSKYTSVAA